jgi:hypothetical protein
MIGQRRNEEIERKRMEGNVGKGKCEEGIRDFLPLVCVKNRSLAGGFPYGLSTAAAWATR